MAQGEVYIPGMPSLTIEHAWTYQVEFFARDVFHHLSEKRFIGKRITKSRTYELSMYHKYVGQACAYKLQVAGEDFRKIIRREYPRHVMGSHGFGIWFSEAFTKHFSPQPSMPFVAILESLSFMFEVVLHAAEVQTSYFYRILPSVYMEFFMKHLFTDFYYSGNWLTLYKVAADAVKKYEAGEGDGLEILKRLRISELEESRRDPKNSVLVIKSSLHARPVLNGCKDFEKIVEQMSDLKIEKFPLHNMPGPTIKDELPSCEKSTTLLSDYLQEQSPSDYATSSSETIVEDKLVEHDFSPSSTETIVEDKLEEARRGISVLALNPPLDARPVLNGPKDFEKIVEEMSDMKIEKFPLHNMPGSLSSSETIVDDKLIGHDFSPSSSATIVECKLIEHDFSSSSSEIIVEDKLIGQDFSPSSSETIVEDKLIRHNFSASSSEAIVEDKLIGHDFAPSSSDKIVEEKLMGEDFSPSSSETIVEDKLIGHDFSPSSSKTIIEEKLSNLSLLHDFVPSSSEIIVEDKLMGHNFSPSSSETIIEDKLIGHNVLKLLLNKS